MIADWEFRRADLLFCFDWGYIFQHHIWIFGLKCFVYGEERQQTNTELGKIRVCLLSID